MINFDDLYKAYYKARHNKKNSIDFIDFEVDRERKLVNLFNAINDRTFKADCNYTFICLDPKPREIFACNMESRIVQWYVYMRIQPILEEVLVARNFNNRKKMGVDAAVKRVYDDITEVSNNYTENAYYIQLDLSGFFPNAKWEVAEKCLINLIKTRYNGPDKEDLIWMVHTTLYADPQNHCYRKSPEDMWKLIDPSKSLFNKDYGTGGAIGFLIWQIAMSLYLNEIDHWFVDELGLRYTRFVDDIVIITKDKKYVLGLLPELRKRLDAIGCHLNEKKTHCDHYSKGIHFLGKYIKYQRIYVDNKTIAKFFNKIKKFNKISNKKDSLLDFQSSMNSYFGLLKNKSEYNNICRAKALIDEKWWKYFVFSEERKCVMLKPKYRYKKLIRDKFKQTIDKDVAKPLTREAQKFKARHKDRYKDIQEEKKKKFQKKIAKLQPENAFNFF
jgi:RNA-directed DNA polymerase